MTHILITGANGQLGNAIRLAAAQLPSFQFHYTDYQELDICSEEAIDDFFDQYPIAWCINCAAYTAVDKAESEQEMAEKINVTGPRLLAAACTAHDARMIHISSDYVYHNALNRPLLEDDPTNPQSVYAVTKLAGDEAVLEEAPESIIIRTSWVYGIYGHNFVKTMLRLGAERDSLNVVYDQIGAPTYTKDIAAVLMNILVAEEKGQALSGGIYHYANEGVTSWYDFAVAIMEEAGLACRVLPILTTQYPTPSLHARRSVCLTNKNRQR
ncbi:MAG: dTDP-4-dehydrorhamnose reductase [Bacteroidia bacterium]